MEHFDRKLKIQHLFFLYLLLDMGVYLSLCRRPTTNSINLPFCPSLSLSPVKINLTPQNPKFYSALKRNHCLKSLNNTLNNITLKKHACTQ